MAQALGLAAVYSHSDMAADSAERILPHGRVWRLKYKALKQNAATPADVTLIKRILQGQIKTILERENPSGFAEIRFPFPYGGSLECILQVDDIKDGDAYIYVFIVLASNEYFQQRNAWSNRGNTPNTGVDASSPDF